jgi:hypothetical protein
MKNSTLQGGWGAEFGTDFAILLLIKEKGHSFFYINERCLLSFRTGEIAR